MANKKTKTAKKKREILFRGKQAVNDNWVVGSLLIDEHDNYYIGAKINLDTKQEYYRCTRNNGKTVDRFIGIGFCVVDSETVGQYIGLKDKNGKNIFEGDIIKYKPFWRTNDDAGELYKTEWKDESCGFEPFSDSVDNCHHCGGGLDSTECEVIGNIYDNPELLEVIK